MNYNANLISKTLSNGMRVFLIHKPDYVKSLFLCGFGVGGFNICEDVNGDILKNRSGIAHFLEHQMFRYQSEDVTNLFAQMQAQTNAFTSYTETAYYFSTTADVKEPLALLLDFVQNLDIDAQSVQKEKGIILSEYNMYDQNPEMRMLRELFQSLYFHHPLTMDVLGTCEDISEMSVEDLSQFYHRNYDPSKLVLVGVSGKDTSELLSFIEAYEEKYPSLQNVVCKPHFDVEPMEVVRKEFVQPMDISETYVCVGYKLEPAGTVQDCLKKDLMASMWLDSVFGPMNPNYQSWIDDEILSSVCGAEADFTMDHAYILFYAQTSRVDAFVSLVEELVHEKAVLDPCVFESLKAQGMARNLRALDHFESLAIDVLRASLEGYDYFQEIQMVDDLKKSDVDAFISSLSFDSVAKVQIVPKVSNL